MQLRRKSHFAVWLWFAPPFAQTDKLTLQLQRERIRFCFRNVSSASEVYEINSDRKGITPCLKPMLCFATLVYKISVQNFKLETKFKSLNPNRLGFHVHFPSSQCTHPSLLHSLPTSRTTSPLTLNRYITISVLF